MRVLLTIFMLFTSFMASAQITDVLDSAAKTARTVAGTEAAIDNVATSPDNIKAAAQTGNNRKTASSLKKTARSVDSAASGLNALTGSNINSSGVSDTLKEGANILTTQANTESAADATVRSATRFQTAIEKGNLSSAAGAIRSVGSNANRTVKNFNKFTGGSAGMDSMKGARDSLNSISTRLRGAAQVQRSGQRISKSANKISDGIKSGNLSQVASGLKSMSSGIKSGEKGMSKAATGSNKTSSSRKSGSGSSTSSSSSSSSSSGSSSSSSSSGSSGSSGTSGGSSSGSTGGSSGGSSGSSGDSGSSDTSSTTSATPSTPTETIAQPEGTSTSSLRTLSQAKAPRKLKGMNTKYNTKSKTLDTILQREQLNVRDAMTGKLGVETKTKENFHR